MFPVLSSDGSDTQKLAHANCFLALVLKGSGAGLLCWLERWGVRAGVTTCSGDKGLICQKREERRRGKRGAAALINSQRTVTQPLSPSVSLPLSPTLAVT